MAQCIVQWLRQQCHAFGRKSNRRGQALLGVKFHCANYRFNLGTEIYYTSGSTIDLTTGFAIGGEAILEAKLGPCPGITELEVSAPQVPRGVYVEEKVMVVEDY